MLLAVAPNGARRTKLDHPALPLSPAQIAEAAASAADAGAAMVHLHVRDKSGAHVLDAGLYRDAIRAVRSAVGERMIIQVTTEAVGRYRPPEQMAVVRDVRPEAVSLALRELCPDAAHEPGFAGFLSWLNQENVMAQTIFYEAADVTRFADMVARGLVPNDAPAVIYVLGQYGGAEARGPADLIPFLAAAGDRLENFMVCAFGAREAACVVAGALLGGDARVGFENNLFLPDGRLAPDNAALVAAVAEPLTRLGCLPATADDVRGR